MERNRILIIRTGGLGDTILLWPAIQCMRQRFPTAQIDLMGNRESCELLAVEGGVDLAIDVEGSGLHYLFEISASLPDKVCTSFQSYDTVVAFAAPGDYALAENLSACGVGEVHAFLPYPVQADTIHIADHTINSLAGVDLARPVEPALLPVSKTESEDGRRKLDQLDLAGHKPALIAPGSGSTSKNWAAQSWAELLPGLEQEGRRPVLLQGPADAESVEQVQNCLENPVPVLVSNSARELKGALAQAVLFVGNDSGPAHLAAALGIPTVAIFGPSDPLLWSPKGPQVEIVQKPVACAPCEADSRRACHERICLDGVEVDQVLAGCRELLSRAPN
ncbi:MAG: glycosyltransferase family 9 protein [Deltaproteobacteria bacterium]|nr:glycosyltransferase family 9 protein [Deltaproteobacteria bacterium]